MDYKLYRSKRRTVSISFSKEGEVVVRAPNRTSAAVIDRFVQSHAAWINKSQSRFLSGQQECAAAFDGRSILVHGEKVQFEGDPIAELKRLAEAELPLRLAALAKAENLSFTQVKLSTARSYWGNCSSSRVIRLNVMLVSLPIELSDYVMMHELTHLEHLNHSARFWTALARRVPHCKEKQKAVKEFQYLMRMLK